MKNKVPEEEEDTDHSQQVASGWQSAVVRDLHSISSQMRQLRVFDHHLKTNEEGTGPPITVGAPPGQT